MKTYQIIRGRYRDLLSEAWSALRGMRRCDYAALASELIRRRDLALSRIAEDYGVTWRACHLLEVGCGQRCSWSQLFGQFNRITAVDLDVVPLGFDARAYWDMLRLNGPYRLAKTVLRKTLAVDRRERAALQSAMPGGSAWPTVCRMDAQDLRFPDGRFDGAFSYAAFEHIQDPRKAMSELARVVKDRGVVYIVLELFTSIAGSHDPRLWRNSRALPLWAHLRPTCAGRCRSNVFINRLRMREFEQTARDVFEDVHLFPETNGTEAYLAELSLSERAELSDYSDEELCTQDLVIMGRRRSTQS